jgi:hypothetical protein
MGNMPTTVAQKDFHWAGRRKDLHRGSQDRLSTVGGYLESIRTEEIIETDQRSNNFHILIDYRSYVDLRPA